MKALPTRPSPDVPPVNLDVFRIGYGAPIGDLDDLLDYLSYTDFEPRQRLEVIEHFGRELTVRLASGRVRPYRPEDMVSRMDRIGKAGGGL